MPPICLAVAICCVEYYSVHGDKTIPCTVQAGRQVTATLCAPRCRDKLLLVYRRIFVKIFCLRNRILSPQQVAQISLILCIPIPSPDGFVEGRCKCVFVYPHGYLSASTINEWNELLEFKWLPSMFTYGVISL